MDVRRQALGYSNLLYDPANAARGERAASAVDEEPALIFTGLCQDFPSNRDVALQCLLGFAFQRDIALLLAFSPDQHQPVRGVQIAQLDPYELRIAQPAAIEQLEDGAISFGK